MQKFDCTTCVVFDLDDTLYKEIDFLRSAYRHIAAKLLPFTSIDVYAYMLELYNSKKVVFDVLKKEYVFPYSVSDLVQEYRNHIPDINLCDGVLDVLMQLKKRVGSLGILTDGRSITQRNKIASLGIEDFFNDIRISEETGCEKPAEACFNFFKEKYPSINTFIYIADNIKKDFITANKLGWITYGIRSTGENIHTQDLKLEKEYYPNYWLTNIRELQPKCT
jgi:putative hydrolase of the HAD superfamily